MEFDTSTRGASKRGFSLIEIMVTVALMSVIIFGLYTMFNQTQKALRMTNAQVDVLEAGRGAMDIIVREIEQAAYTGIQGTNPVVVPQMSIWIDYAKDASTTLFPSNVIQQFFFMTRPGGLWTANGFFVATTSTNTTRFPNKLAFDTNVVNGIGVGALYRFSKVNKDPYRIYGYDLFGLNNHFQNAKSGLYQAAEQSANANPVYPVIDGVVHFRLTPYDSQGRPIIYTNFPAISSELDWKKIMSPYRPDVRTVWEPAAVVDEKRYESQVYFQSNALPAYIDVELGVLESQIHERVKSLPNKEAQLRQMTNQAPAIHFFHKLIPIRNAQP